MLNKPGLSIALIAALSIGAAFADTDLTQDSSGQPNYSGPGNTANLTPVTGLLDDFNRANGLIGSKWTDQQGVFSVVSKAAQGGTSALATYNGGSSNILEADIQASGTGVQYVALVLGYATLAKNYFIKVQQQDGGGKFDHAACQYGNNGTVFGPGFFALAKPFAKAHMKAVLSGTTVTLSFSAIDGGTSTQTYTCSNAPATGGTGIGIGSYDANNGSLDNVSAGPIITTTAIQTIGIPDLNGNGASEEATLVADSSTKAMQVWIRDGKTGALLYKNGLGTGGYTPLGLAVAPDMDKNGKPEIATLFSINSNGAVNVTIHDATTNALIKVIPFGTLQAKSITVLDDTDGNQVPEIAVMHQLSATNTFRLDVRDALSGALVRTINLP